MTMGTASTRSDGSGVGSEQHDAHGGRRNHGWRRRSSRGRDRPSAVPLGSRRGASRLPPVCADPRADNRVLGHERVHRYGPHARDSTSAGESVLPGRGEDVESSPRPHRAFRRDPNQPLRSRDERCGYGLLLSDRPSNSGWSCSRLTVRAHRGARLIRDRSDRLYGLEPVQRQRKGLHALRDDHRDRHMAGSALV